MCFDPAHPTLGNLSNGNKSTSKDRYIVTDALSTVAETESKMNVFNGRIAEKHDLATP
jgi:hypothetical protein